MDRWRTLWPSGGGGWHMRSLLWSYLGSRRFPREMSTFEVRHFFTLSSDDRHVLRRRFHSRSRLGAALQLGFVRMTGTTLDAFDYVPRAVLEHLGNQLGISAPELTTLRALLTCCALPPRSMRGGARRPMYWNDSAVLRVVIGSIEPAMRWANCCAPCTCAITSRYRTFADPSTGCSNAENPSMPCSAKFALNRYPPSEAGAPRSCSPRPAL